MDVELLEFRDFLAEHEPFDRLPATVLDTLPALLSIRYLRRGSPVPERDRGAPALSLVRAGAIELSGAEGVLLARLGEGELFGPGTRPRDASGEQRARALEDCLLYRLPMERLDALCKEHPPLARWFAPAPAGRVNPAGEPASRMTTSLAELMSPEPVSLPSRASVREAAERMSERGVSSLLVIDDERLVGIVTDRDLRLRVIVQGCPHEAPLARVMTTSPVVVPPDAIACDALLIMAQRGLHHLPVVSDDRVIGLVSSSDLIERRATSTIRRIAGIRRCEDAVQLAHTVKDVAGMIGGLVDAAVPAPRAARLIAGVGDAFTRRQLQLIEAERGAAPVPYTWVALGAQGRCEACAALRPSVALILDERYVPERHEAWFADVIRQACERLHEAGPPFGPVVDGDGKAVGYATASRWRDVLVEGVARDTEDGSAAFADWLDLRTVHGPPELRDALANLLQERVRNAHEPPDRLTWRLARAALRSAPPLCVFRDAVVLADGSTRPWLDPRADALAMIAGLARARAPLPGVDTPTRLTADVGNDSSIQLFDVATAGDLLLVHDWFCDLRLRHQARRLKEGDPAGDRLAPRHLSRRERGELGEVFGLLHGVRRRILERLGAHAADIGDPAR